MISVYFAPPGIGKSTLCARIAFWEHVKKKLHISKYNRVYSNFPLKYTYLYEKEDLGMFSFGDGHNLILCDEAGIWFYAREYKRMEKKQIEFFKLARHYHCDIILFSQSFDIDKSIRDNAPELRYLKRCTLLPYHIKALRIHKSIMVDEIQHQLLDGYEFDPIFTRIFTTRRYYLPFYWGMFDSWDAPDLEEKPGGFKYYDGK